VLGDHDADVGMLVAAVRAQAQREMGRMYLEPAAHRSGWQLKDCDVAGRLELDPDGGPYRVVVDGRPLSWEEFGRALEAFEGWRFRLTIEHPSTDVRSPSPPPPGAEPT
jgi:hypothetical protein